MIHWSENKGHLVVYHGTHIKNIPHILKNGINNKDPKTGMISVAIGSHGADIAHGYAAMSGEYGFRQAGNKAVTVPHEQRAIVTAHLPMDWVHKNVDRNFGGNPTDVKHRLADPGLHFQHVIKTGSDFSPTETPELRFKEPIPAKYIKGYTQKGKKMKTFKEFSESDETSSVGDKRRQLFRKIASLPIKDLRVVHHQLTQDGHRAARFTAAELKKRGFDEEVATNAMSAQAPSAIANPQNRMLFKSIGKRKRINDSNQGVDRDPGQSEPERRSEYFRTHRKRQMKLGAGE